MNLVRQYGTYLDSRPQIVQEWAMKPRLFAFPSSPDHALNRETRAERVRDRKLPRKKGEGGIAQSISRRASADKQEGTGTCGKLLRKSIHGRVQQRLSTR